MFLRGGRRIYKCNQRLAEILGYDSVAELIGLNKSELHLSRESFDRFGASYYETLRSRDNLQVVYPLRRKDGATVWCSLSGVALDSRRPADLDKGVLWVVDDVTVQREQSERLRLSELRMRSVFNALSEAVLLLSPERRLLDVNAATERMFGYSLKQLRSLSTRTLHVDEAHYQEFGRRIEEAFSRGETATFEFEARRSDGEVFPTEHHVALLKNNDGDSMGIVSVVRDVSGRKEAERAIKESEAKFRRLFHAAAIPLCYVDDAGVIQGFNPKFTQTFGYGAQDVATLDDWWRLAYPDPEYRAWVVKTWERAVDEAAASGKDIQSLEYRVTCKNGEVRRALISGTAFEDKFLATFVDVTDIRRYEDELADNARRLEQANAELNQYAYVVSHDLKAPLRAMHNYASFLREDLGDKELTDEVRQYLQGLSKAVEQCGELVDDLLELSRIGRHAEVKELDFGQLAAEAINGLSLPAEAEVELSGPGTRVVSNPTLLRQIVTNLVSNGVKFNTSPKRLVRLSWTVSGEGGLAIQCRDNGIGIEERYFKQIFQVFQRLHASSEYEGTGVGLAIVKKAAETLGGTVDVTSSPGAGSAFGVSLPPRPRGSEGAITEEGE